MPKVPDVDFPFEVPLTSNQLEAIGHVSALWAFLETELDMLLEYLSKTPECQGLTERYPREFSRRMCLARDIAKRFFDDHKEAQSAFQAIIQDASTLRDERDAIIHGRWGSLSDENAGVLVVKTVPGLTFIDRDFSLRDVKKVASKISKINWRLLIFERDYRHLLQRTPSPHRLFELDQKGDIRLIPPKPEKS